MKIAKRMNISSKLINFLKNLNIIDQHEYYQFITIGYYILRESELLNRNTKEINCIKISYANNATMILTEVNLKNGNIYKFNFPSTDYLFDGVISLITVFQIYELVFGNCKYNKIDYILNPTL